MDSDAVRDVLLRTPDVEARASTGRAAMELAAGTT